MLGCGGNPLIERLRAKTTSTKTPVLASLLRQKRPVEFAVLTYVSQQDRAVWSQPSDHTLRKFHEVLFSVYEDIFDNHLHLQTVYFNFKMASHLKLQVEIENWLANIFWDFKPHLKKPSVISHYLAVLIGHDSAELWWFVVRPSLNSNIPCRHLVRRCPALT